MRSLVLMIMICFLHIMTAGKVQLRGVMLSFKVQLKLVVKRKMLSNTGYAAGDKASNANDKTVASIFDNKFCIPLDFEIS